MDDDPNAATGAPGILDAMLSPLRLPGRVASDIDNARQDPRPADLWRTPR